PFRIELILRRKRNAVQRTSILTSGYSMLRLTSSLSSLILTDSEIGVELRVQTLYAFQVGFYNLNWGDLFCLDLSRKLCDRKKMDICPLHTPSFRGDESGVGPGASFVNSCHAHSLLGVPQ